MANRSANLVEHLENYNVENTALHRKLQTNVEVIRILRQELDKFRTERDQFKLMAETIQLRYCAMKSAHSTDSDPFIDSSVTRLLSEMRERNLKLSTDLARTKEKLQEKEGDIEALRQEKELVSRVALRSQSAAPPPVQDSERQGFIAQQEASRKTIAQLKFDLHSMLDDKNELFTEKEAYKMKAARLQKELEATVRGNQGESLNEAERLRENRELKERMRNMEKDLEMGREIILKYKKYVEAHRKQCPKEDEEVEKELEGHQQK